MIFSQGSVTFKDEKNTTNTCNPTELLGEGANGSVFQCSDESKESKYVLKLDNNDSGRYALKGEFDFIKWTPENEIEKKYDRVAKMYRVICSTDNEDCEQINKEESFDKKKVVIEKIYTLKYYLIGIRNNPQFKTNKTKYMSYKKYLIDKLIKAINELHALGYCHNDLKPDNIGTTSNGTIKFIDMGTAVPITKEHKSKYYTIKDTDIHYESTIEYAVPIYVKHITHDHYRDHWAIGCVIYDIANDFNGTLFEGENHSQIVTSLLNINEDLLKERIKERLNAIESLTTEYKTYFFDTIFELMKPTLHTEYTIYDHDLKITDDGTKLVYSKKEPLQQGGKKKHNTGENITKERYDKEKIKLSKNVSHVRKYNTKKGHVYYIFKKT